jgi:hypothetical protein
MAELNQLLIRNRALQAESDGLRADNDRLQRELGAERQLRLKAQEKASHVEADRGRLQVRSPSCEEAPAWAPRHQLHPRPPRRTQHARDELARSLLLAERRAADAEEDTQRAERDLAEAQAAAAAAAAAASVPPSTRLEAELEVERRRSAQLSVALDDARAQAAAAAAPALPAQRSDQQLHHGAADSLAGAAARVSALKASRDKLIAALDAAAADVERLSAENAALAEVGCCRWGTAAGRGDRVG